MGPAESIAAIAAHLDGEPWDWHARAALADIYEEVGDESRTLLQRWLIKHRKCPSTPGPNRLWNWYGYGESGNPDLLDNDNCDLGPWVRGTKAYRPNESRSALEELLIPLLEEHGWEAWVPETKTFWPEWMAKRGWL